MLVAWLALVVALLGLVLYMVATNAKAAELGRIMFFAGLLVTLFGLARHLVHVP